MKNIFSNISQKVGEECPRIVFPEGEDDRVIEAASLLDKEKLIQPILIGREKVIINKLKNCGSPMSSVSIINLSNFSEREYYKNALYDIREGKISRMEAEERMSESNYLATVLLKEEQADGLVGGAKYATQDILRPALQIIKPSTHVSKVSSFFIMLKEDKVFFYADCAVNVAPKREELAEIAYLTASSAEMFNMSPRIAFLSYSTKGSAASEETAEVHHAMSVYNREYGNWPVDGEIQFDAAVIPEISQKKSPDSPLQGRANVFIFPNLDAANIGYKITQRLGEFEAIGPVLQGLNKPVNDLSRGCSSRDVYYMALVTGMQHIEKYHQSKAGKST